MNAVVAAVSRSSKHTLVKPNQDSIRLLPGLGVDGDAHQGATVKHRSRVARDPTQPNLRQVHLIHAELHEELRLHGLAPVEDEPLTGYRRFYVADPFGNRLEFMERLAD